jgi:hypothetical protein
LRRRPPSAKDLDQFFEFEPHLMDELLALIEIHLRIVAGEAVAGSADGEALFIQEAPNLPNDEHILALIVAPVAAALDGLQLRELLLPVAQHVRLDAAQLADFADGEVALPGIGGSSLLLLGSSIRLDAGLQFLAGTEVTTRRALMGISSPVLGCARDADSCPADRNYRSRITSPARPTKEPPGSPRRTNPRVRVLRAC